MDWVSFCCGFAVGAVGTLLLCHWHVGRLLRDFRRLARRMQQISERARSPAPLLGVPVHNPEPLGPGPGTQAGPSAALGAERRSVTTFRVLGFGGNTFEEVELVVPMATPAGHLFKVREAGKKNPKLGTVSMEQVHPDDRERLLEVVARHPGTSEVFEFDPFGQ